MSTDYKSILGLTNIPAGLETALKELFGQYPATVRFPINNRIYFDRYFSLSLLSSDFTETEFKTIWELENRTRIAEELVRFNLLNSPLLAEKLESNRGFMIEKAKSKTLEVVGSLLSLFHDVVVNFRDNSSNLRGINRNALSVYIMDVLKESRQNDLAKVLRQIFLDFPVEFYISFSMLLDPSNIYLYFPSKEIALRRRYFELFRDIQLVFLERLIKAEFKLDMIIRQIQTMHLFVRVTDSNAYISEDQNWYVKNVLVKYRGFFAKKAIEIKNLLLSKHTIKGIVDSFDLAESMQQIFHSPENLRLLQTDHFNSEIENLREAYEGYFNTGSDFYGFTGRNTFLTANIDSFPKKFKAHESLKLKLSVESLHWNLAVRYSNRETLSDHRKKSDDLIITFSQGIRNGTALISTGLRYSIAANIRDPEFVNFAGSIEHREFYVELLLDVENNLSLRIRTLETETRLIPVADAKPYRFIHIYSYGDTEPYLINARIETLNRFNVEFEDVS